MDFETKKKKKNAWVKLNQWIFKRKKSSFYVCSIVASTVGKKIFTQNFDWKKKKKKSLFAVKIQRLFWEHLVHSHGELNSQRNLRERKCGKYIFTDSPIEAFSSLFFIPPTLFFFYIPCFVRNFSILCEWLHSKFYPKSIGE